MKKQDNYFLCNKCNSKFKKTCPDNIECPIYQECPKCGELMVKINASYNKNRSIK